MHKYRQNMTQVSRTNEALKNGVILIILYVAAIHSLTLHSTYEII